MNSAEPTVLPNLKTLGRMLLVLERIVIPTLALGAGQHHHHTVLFFRHLVWKLRIRSG
jgi:hypothetical protein